jgi:DNA repair protein RadC
MPIHVHPSGTPFPLGTAFPPSPLENAMQNLSALSRESLVGELLSPPIPESIAVVLADAAPTYLSSPGASVATAEDRLQRKLTIARELLLRDLHAQMQSRPVMDSPQVLREWLRLYCAGLEHEVFIVVYLDVRHHVIDAAQLFRGTLTQTCVYPREVVKSALERNAAAVALAHNHPSGGAEPSRADEYLTQTLKSALGLVDVRVIDHLIVAGDTVLSLAERGLL